MLATLSGAEGAWEDQLICVGGGVSERQAVQQRAHGRGGRRWDGMGWVRVLDGGFSVSWRQGR